eukprot:Hpha_TRINITY_DN33779_c0_g1::TRINITY_DN33779_c0_g1_i1::g.25044::m.25044/K14800/TSR2; pre-rRNA-processing protein TSR2
MAAAAPVMQRAETGKCPKYGGDAFARFQQGVHAVFESWTGLQLLQEQLPAARRVVNDLERDVSEWFERQGEIFPDELESHFESELSNEANADLEDGSCKEVANVLNLLYRECAVGCFTRVEHLVDQARQSGQAAAACVAAPGSEDALTWDMLQDDEGPAAAAGGDDDDDEVMSVGEADGAAAVHPAPPAPAAAAPAAPNVLKDVVNELLQRVGPPKDRSRLDLLQALHGATAALLTEAGAPPEAAAAGPPRSKKRRNGKNAVVDGGDGWATVVK